MKNLFCFNGVSDFVFANGSYIANIQKNHEEKELLFNDYAEKLKFPSYFGKNWDALLDCLSDLFFVKEKNVIIAHSDMPFQGNETERKIYLSVLHEAIERTRDSQGHKLYVYFPWEYKKEIDSIISDPNFPN